jgi:diaminopimelate decarboxylase
VGSRRGAAAMLPALCEKVFHSGVSVAPASVAVMSALELFPDTAAVADGELVLGGVMSSSLADIYGTPLVVYCEATLRARAQAYRQSAPEATVLYSVKAFPNVAVLRLLAEEGLGAEASTLGELTYAQEAGIGGDAIVLDGNNKSDDELRAGAEAGCLVVLDAPDDAERAAAAGVRRVLVRVTPGIDADTHWAIQTGHRGSKFGLTPEQATETLARCAELELAAEGFHVHIGSQLLDLGAERMTVDFLAAFAADCRSQLGWTPATVDLGGGLGIRYTEEDPRLDAASFVQTLIDRVRHAWTLHDLPQPRIVLEPGRSLVGQAGVTLYRVGSVKPAGENVTYVAVDGGMSDNPRPQLYGARHSALLASRASERPAAPYAVCGKHCESADVMIERVLLPEPRRGDVLAVAATGAYTLGMSSNYNAVARPAAVLVSDGEARVIRRRETVDDLLALEA